VRRIDQGGSKTKEIVTAKLSASRKLELANRANDADAVERTFGRDYELFRRFELKNRLFLSLVVWEAIVLGCVAILMLMQRRSLNSENLHKIGFIFGLGMLVVLLVRPLSRLVSRRTGSVLGFIIGLAVPPLCAWIWAWLLPFPWWTGPFDIKILSVVLSAPSAFGGAVVGAIQSE
jgi:predicted lysophospholipase L1 biosynthesis ABC-type transport system permease subunit